MLFLQVCTFFCYLNGFLARGSSTKGSVINGANSFSYIALQGTTKDPLPQVKFGKILNLRLFGVCF